MDLVEYLISRGVDLNKKNHLGQTVMNISAERNDLSVMRILINSNAKIYIDHTGISMLTTEAFKCKYLIKFSVRSK